MQRSTRYQYRFDTTPEERRRGRSRSLREHGPSAPSATTDYVYQQRQAFNRQAREQARKAGAFRKSSRR